MASLKKMCPIAVLGAGNLGVALARGWRQHGGLKRSSLHLTRRRSGKLAELAEQGYRVGGDNRLAVENSKTVVLAVQPQQLDGLVEEIAPALDPSRHLVISVVSGASSESLREKLPDGTPLVRAMPNTAVSLGEAMTCLSVDGADEGDVLKAEQLFAPLGRTLRLAENMMTPATALSACGVAFFLRCIRAASQGGIEIGFHPEEALELAAQTARGAASLLLEAGGHPEAEIDRVTTPRGCTIAGLNEMEHRGLSSALIRGIVVSGKAAGELEDQDRRRLAGPSSSSDS